MPYLRTPFSRENNDSTMIIFLIIHETNIYTLQIFLFNKLTKSRQNLYRKPQTRDTFLPKIRPQVSIHLRHRNLSPSSLLLSLFLSVRTGSRPISCPPRQRSIFPSFPPPSGSPVVPGHWFRSVPSLYSLVAETEGGGRDERHCERGSVAGRGEREGVAVGDETDSLQRRLFPLRWLEKRARMRETLPSTPSPRGPRQLLIRRLASAAVAISRLLAQRTEK